MSFFIQNQLYSFLFFYYQLLHNAGAKLPFIYHRINFFSNFFTEFVNFHVSKVLCTLLAYVNLTVFSLLLTDHEHVRNVLNLIVTDLAANLLVTVIYKTADLIFILKLLLYLVSIVISLF